MCCLYKLTLPDGLAYIGITRKTAQQRLAKHIEDAKGGRDTSVADALRRCKFKGVKIVTLLTCDNWQLINEMEKIAIEYYGTKIPHGHNATDGGPCMRGVISKNIMGEYVDSTSSAV